MVKKNDKRGATVQTIVMVFIGVIVCAVLLVSIAQSKGQLTDLLTVTNSSLSATVVNGTAQYITNCRALSNVVVFNETNGTATFTAEAPEVGSGNYTVTNNQVYNGALAVKITPEATAGFKSKWQISGTCQPLTYDDNSASRTIIDLVIILAALALAVFVLEYAGLTDLFGRN